jgi:hypothetical protein
MKKITLSVLIVAVAFAYSISAIAQVPQVTLTNTIHAATVNFNGLNGQNTTHDGTYWRQLSLSTDAVSSLKELHPSMVRYPAGTISNYWDWLKAWYVDSLTVMADNCPGIPDEFALNANVVTGQPNSIDNYLAYIRNTGATPVIVLNVLTSELNYQLNFLRAMAARGVPITYVELGNEFYLENCFYSTKYNAADDYVAECATYITAIKSEWANAKVAIVGAEANDNDLTRRKNWVTDILNACNSHQVVPDAITIHMYSGTGVAGGCAGNTITTAKAEQALSAVPFALGLNQASGALGNTDGIIYQEIAAIKAKYQNCEIWFTEYDMSDKDVPVHGKWVQGMYVAAIALHFLEDENIKHNTFHAMTGDALQAAFIGTDDAAFAFKEGNCTTCGNINTTSNHYKFTAMGQCLSMVNKAFSIGGNATKLDFNNSNTITYKKGINPNAIYYYYPALYGWQFSTNGGTQKQAIILNSSGISYTTTIDPTVIPYTNAFYETVSANPDNYIINGQQYLTSTCAATLPLITASGAFAGSITLPPFSITRLYYYEPAIGISASAVKPILCEGESTTLSATGEDNWTYSWSPSNDLSNTTDQNPVLTATINTSSIYTVTVTDGASNTYTATVAITVNPKTPVNILTSNPVSCIGDPITLTANPVGLISYNWAKVGQSLSNTNTLTVTPDKPDQYFVWALNSKGCYSEAYINLPTENVYFDLGKDQVLCTNESKTIILPNSGTQNYQWIIDNKVVGSAETYTFTPTATGTYVLSGTVNQNGCTYTNAVTITVVNCCSTPNNYAITSETTMADLLAIPGTIPIPEENRYNVANANITISGVWDISSIVEFKNCDITMQPGAKINVLPYQRIYLKGTTINGCNEMWQGIYLYPHARLFCNPTLNNVTTIADAVNAVYANDFSYFNINGTTFNNNFIGINTPLVTPHTTYTLRSIYGSNFYSNGSLLPPYAGKYPFAGAMLNYTCMTVGVLGQSANQFGLIGNSISLNNGIVAGSSQLTVVNSRFDGISNINHYNLAPDGCGIYAVAKINQYSTLLQTGFGKLITFQPTFVNCNTAVATNNVATDCSLNRVLYSNTGFTAVNNWGSHVFITNNDIATIRIGIALTNNENAASVNAENNFITNCYPNPPSGLIHGIECADLNSPNSARVYSIHCNTITGNIFSGITANNMALAHIHSNNILLNHPDGFYGIGLFGGTTNWVTANTTTTTQWNPAAYYLQQTNQPVISDNISTGAITGYDFQGMCTNAVFKTNTVGFHNKGLHLNSNGVMGKQPDPALSPNKSNANIWQQDLNSTLYTSGYGAINDNNQGQFAIDQSSFIVNDPVKGSPANPHDLVSNSVGYQWYFYNPNAVSKAAEYGYDCVMRPIKGDEVLTDLDLRILHDSVTTVDFEPETSFIGASDLMDKLAANDSLRLANTDYETYYDAKQTETLGELSKVRQALKNSNNIDPYSRQQLAINDTLVHNLMKALLPIDSALFSSTITYNDSLAKIAERTTMTDEISKLVTLNNQLLQQLQNEKISLETAAQSLNEAVTTITDISSNEKQWNAIYLDKVSSSNYNLTLTQLNTIHFIANQCPFTGGRVVYKARTVLKMLGDTTIYNDAGVCAALGILRKASTQKNEIILSELKAIPNPTNGIVSFSYESFENNKIIIEITNTLGLKVAEFETENANTTTGNLGNLPNGIYCCRLIVNGNLLGSCKIAIVR